MMSNNLENQKVWVVSIHDRDQTRCLDVSLPKLLNALGPYVKGLNWIALDQDVTGTPLQEGQAYTTDELVEASETLGQVIDGRYIGYLGEVPPVHIARKHPVYFPTSPAQVVIKVVDSSFCLLYLKERGALNRILVFFNDVRFENPDKFFF